MNILNSDGIGLNPLTNKPFSPTYLELAKIWSTYPVYKHAKEIIDAIEKFQLIFIVSGTGSGKTVIVPKLALYETNWKGKIGVTLPKKNIVISSANFAAKTLDITLGEQVGYLYRGSPIEFKNANKLLYMTDGSLISLFTKDPNLSEYKIIIIDEAHERKIQIDLLLLFFKRALIKRHDLKLIIMSATVDINKYTNYFNDIKSKVFHISGQPLFPIEVHFLKSINHSYLDAGECIINKLIENNIRDDILFFITQSSEAFMLCQRIRTKYPFVYCIEVYADMNKNLLEYVESSTKYKELGNYEMKIVLATEVIESSITINKLKYVLDSCHKLQSLFNPNTGTNELNTSLITKAQSLQRRGRVGRIEPGICYHLLTEKQFNELPEFIQPDILTSNITSELIRVSQFIDSKDEKTTIDFFNKLMDVPKQEYIDYSFDLFNLYHIVENGNFVDLNKYAAFTTLHLHETLAIIYSYKAYVAKEITIIIAMINALSNKISNIYYVNTKGKRENKDIRKYLSKKGDHFSLLKLFQTYKKQDNKKKWCIENALRFDIFAKAEKEQKSYYGKILNLHKQQGGVENKDEQILNVLIKSHIHLTANKNLPIYPKKKIAAKISPDSFLYKFYKKDQLNNKKFIYNNLSSVNNERRFNIVTII